MKVMTTARLTLGSMVLGMLLVAAADPARAFPVVVAADPANYQNWISQLTHMLTQIQQVKTRITQATTELNRASALRLDRANALQSLANQAIVFNNQNPTAAGAALADVLVHAQSGTVGPNDILALEQEILAANGGMEARAAQADVSITIASQLQAQQTFQATQVLQEQADIFDAQKQRGALLDVNAPDPKTGFSY